MISMPALTREEAVERRRLIDVQDVAVELDLTGARDSETFRSRTVIRFACTEPGAATFVDVKPSALVRAELNGRVLDPGALHDGRLPLDALAAENELLVEAEMAYSHTGEGMHHFTDPEDGEVYLYTQSFLDDGPRVFAAFDQPDLKAVYTMTVAAPEDWTVVGNTTAARGADGRWEFEATQRISSYLVALVAGPLHSVRGEHDGIPLGLHCRRSLGPYLDADAEELFGITAACFDRYHEIFHQRYPFNGSYDQAFVPQFNAGAMENPGCVTIRDQFLFRSAVTDSEREKRGIVIAHEMAHMWFGDLVTLRWWDDIWLNESFAEYMGHQVLVEATRFTEAWTGFAAKRKTWGYDADQRLSTHPVAPEGVADSAQALQNFDGISYAKGASALRQLVAWLGEKDFLAGVNEHFARHRFGNAELADLLDALATVSGRDVRAWGERWLRTTGVDTLRLRLADSEGMVGAAEVTHDTPGGVTRPHRVDLGLYDRVAEGGLVRRDLVPLDLPADGPAEVAGLLGVARPDLVLLNDGDRSFAKIRLDERSWRTATAALSAVPGPTARAVLWSAARDLVRDAELPAEGYLALVAEHLPTEGSVHLVEGALNFARQQVADSYLPPERRPAALELLSGVGRALLRRTEGQPGAEGIRLLAVRALIDAAVTPVDVAELQEWLREDTVPGGPALDPELRWRIRLRLCTFGAAGEDEIAEELSRDPSATGVEGAARCRAALPDPEAKDRAWHAAFHGDLSAYLLTATLQGLWRPEQAGLLEPYVQRYFGDVPAAAQRGPAVARALGQYGFPAFAAEEATVAAAEECLRRDDLTPALRRQLADRLDDVRRAVRAREVAAG
jgi:aminopeptidase N